MRKSPTTDIPGAVSFTYSQQLIEELISLTSKDLKQSRKVMRSLLADELNKLQANLSYLRSSIYEIRYERTPKGLAVLELRNKVRAENAAKKLKDHKDS